jgi:serine protease
MNSLIQKTLHGITALVIIFTSVGMISLPNAVQPTGAQDLPTNRIIIKYKAETPAFATAAKTSQMQRLNSLVGMRLEYFRGMSGDAHVLKLPKHLPLSQVKAISERLMILPEVEYAEPDAIQFPLLIPNDQFYPAQWHYYESVGGANLPAAWDLTTGSNSVRIAVIDTGITNHVDLSGRTIPGFDFITEPLIGNDGNGRDNNPSDTGDWITEDENNAGMFFEGCQARNSSWHGTHVSGTIGAGSNNSIGVAGVNWISKIQTVRVLGKCGGFLSDIADGMRWAAGLPVSGVPNNTQPSKVLNMSLGGAGACGTTYQNAINAINATGAILIVAAGNNNVDANGFRPANCSGVITVAATNRMGGKADYSNFGSTIEISAPGGDTDSSPFGVDGIGSTLNSGTQGPVGDIYVYYQGTSMATPHVSGVVSLMLSKNPNLNSTQIRNILQSTAKPFPGGSTCNTSICGAGMVDAAAGIIAVPEMNKLTVPSIGNNDGWVLESSENSSAGGTLNTAATTFSLGDNVSNKQYRVILSFNTASLPNNAVITKATLRIKSQAISGTNPFNTHGALLVDIRKPSFGNAPLELTDFESPANQLAAATVGKIPANNLYSGNFLNTSLPYINLAGTTQVRLRFNLGDNNDHGADVINFYSGNSPTSSIRPQLDIYYYVP